MPRRHPEVTPPSPPPPPHSVRGWPRCHGRLLCPPHALRVVLRAGHPHLHLHDARASFLCFLLVSRLRRLLRTRPPAALRWGARAAEQGPPWPARFPRTRFPLISSVPLVNPTFQFQSRWLTSSDRPSLLPCRPSSKPSSDVTYAFICK